MKCASCGSEKLERPGLKSAMEQWRCQDCGNEFYVHCNYMPDLSKFPHHDLFVGTVALGSEVQPLKVLLLLKKALSFAERFEPSKLESQFRLGAREWNIGYFLDFEVSRVEEECKRIGINASFEKVID